MVNRITPDEITELKDNEIFVFGSNIEGIHGKGAAKDALKFGAIKGFGFGLKGKTYALPTKLTPFTSLKLWAIKNEIYLFVKFAKENPDKIFLVTRVGCGYAGYKDEDIAPLFKEAINISNINFPESFWKIINENVEI